MHELSLSGAIVNTVVKHADGRQVTVVNLRVGRLRQVVPDTLEFYFEFVARGTVCEGARLEQELVDATPTVQPVRTRVGRSRFRPFCARPAAAATSWWPAGTSSKSSRSRSRRTHASHKGEHRRGRARRQQHDRAGQPGRLRPRRRHRHQLHERARGGQDHAARGRRLEPAGRAGGGARGRRPGLARRRPPRVAARAGDPAQHRSAASAASATWTPTWCARRCPRCPSTRSTCS